MELPKKLQNLRKEEFEEFVNIGFCQPKFYKRSAWLKAKKIMDEVICPAGLAYPFDYGRGKGKYRTDEARIDDVVKKGWDFYQSRLHKLN